MFNLHSRGPNAISGHWKCAFYSQFSRDNQRIRKPWFQGPFRSVRRQSGSKITDLHPKNGRIRRQVHFKIKLEFGHNMLSKGPGGIQTPHKKLYPKSRNPHLFCWQV